MTEPLSLVFDREKTTKNTVRYTERNGAEPVRVGSLYVQKAAATALGDPDTLTVTVAAGEPTP